MLQINKIIDDDLVTIFVTDTNLYVRDEKIISRKATNNEEIRDFLQFNTALQYYKEIKLTNVLV